VHRPYTLPVPPKKERNQGTRGKKNQDNKTIETKKKKKNQEINKNFFPPFQAKNKSKKLDRKTSYPCTAR
jgi:hypothetical protein